MGELQFPNDDILVEVAYLSLEELAQKCSISEKEASRRCRENKKELQKTHGDGEDLYLRSQNLERIFPELAGGKPAQHYAEPEPQKKEAPKKQQIPKPRRIRPIIEQSIDLIADGEEEPPERKEKIRDAIERAKSRRRIHEISTEQKIELSKKGEGATAFASMSAAQSVLMNTYHVKIPEPDLERLCREKDLFVYDPQNNPKLLNTTLKIAVEGGIFKAYLPSKEEVQAYMTEMEERSIKEFQSQIKIYQIPNGVKGDWRKSIDWIMLQEGEGSRTKYATVQQNLQKNGIKIPNAYEFDDYFKRTLKAKFFRERGIAEVDRKTAIVFVECVFNFKEPSNFFEDYRRQTGSDLLKNKGEKITIERFFDCLIKYNQEVIGRMDNGVCGKIVAQYKR